MLTHKYRYYSQESEAEYGKWLAGKTWETLLGANGANEKTRIFQDEVVGALERIFPLVTVWRRSSDPPWYKWLSLIHI